MIICWWRILLEAVMEMVNTDLGLQLCTLTVAKFDIIKKHYTKYQGINWSSPWKRKRKTNVTAEYTLIINNLTILLKQDHEMAKFGGLWRMRTPMENSYQSGFTLKFAIFYFRFFLISSKRTRFGCNILIDFPTPLFIGSYLAVSFSIVPTIWSPSNDWSPLRNVRFPT